MGGGASSSLHAVSTLGLGETSRHKLSTTPAIPQVEGEACGKTMLASWGHGSLPTFGGKLARNPSLQEDNQDPHLSLGAGGRLKALRSPSPQDLGRSQASQEKSQSSCPTSAWVQECELFRQMHDQLRSDMQSLRECVSLLLSECRHNFQELKESLGKAKLDKGEDNRVDFTQNKQLEQQKNNKQMSKKISLTERTLAHSKTLQKKRLQQRGSLASFPRRRKEKEQEDKRSKK